MTTGHKLIYGEGWDHLLRNPVTWVVDSVGKLKSPKIFPWHGPLLLKIMPCQCWVDTKHEAVFLRLRPQGNLNASLNSVWTPRPLIVGRPKARRPSLCRLPLILEMSSVNFPSVNFNVVVLPMIRMCILDAVPFLPCVNTWLPLGSFTASAHSDHPECGGCTLGECFLMNSYVAAQNLKRSLFFLNLDYSPDQFRLLCTFPKCRCMQLLAFKGVRTKHSSVDDVHIPPGLARSSVTYHLGGFRDQETLQPCHHPQAVYKIQIHRWS